MASVSSTQKDALRRRFLNVVQQTDGGAIVFPGGFFGRSFRLTKNELVTYFPWESEHHRRSARIQNAVFVMLIAVTIPLIIVLQGDVGSIVSIFVVFAVIGVWVFVSYQWAIRSFRTRFPDAPLAGDSGKWRRLIRSMLVSCPPWVGVCWGMIAWWVVWTEVERLISNSSRWPPREILVSVPSGIVFVVLGALFVYLTIEHYRFRRRHGRPPNIEDLGPPL